jgi:1-acyl-sn-glycerol-3-phosphate acyltransferase
LPKPYRVKPRLKFIPPHFNPWVMRFVYGTLPLLLRVRLRRWLPAGIWPVVCENPEVLVEGFRQFQAGQMRLLLAFRHSQVDDPLCLSYLFSRLLPRAARQQGTPLQRPIHSHFMYDRGMPLWAGRWLGWFFSRLGGIPVHRGKRLDLQALKTARSHLINGQFPFTIAPEGATNGHGEIVSPLEPGTAQLAFWGVEDLQKAGRGERLQIIPIGLRYIYPRPDWVALNRLLTRLEHDTGLPTASFPQPASVPLADYYPRLLTLGNHLLTRMEQFYQRFYPEHFAGIPGQLSDDSHAAIANRLHQVLEEALTVGEQYFNLSSNGGLITRCRRLEEAGWAYIYREDLEQLPTLPPIERGLADWVATEANLHMRHMRLVESFVAVTGSYVKEHLSFERFAETTLILFDLVERLKGTEVPRRPQLGRRKAVLTIGDPIDVDKRWPQYAENRRAALSQLTSDLQAAMETLARMDMPAKTNNTQHQ